MIEDEYDYCYCKYKFPCPFKYVAKSRYVNGRYYILCLNPDGCNQKSIFAIYFQIPNRIQSLNRKIRFTNKSIMKWKKRVRL